jgi:hypothetical protein
MGSHFNNLQLHVGSSGSGVRLSFGWMHQMYPDKYVLDPSAKHFGSPSSNASLRKFTSACRPSPILHLCTDTYGDFLTAFHPLTAYILHLQSHTHTHVI